MVLPVQIAHVPELRVHQQRAFTAEVKSDFIFEDIEVVSILDVFRVEIVEILAFLELKSVLFGEFGELFNQNEILWHVFDNLLLVLGDDSSSYEPICQIETVGVPERPFVF